ncbi:ABC transporter ATP-binding protein [Parasphaerochaeta coccoides]|uniref:Nucleoside ABC transporter ATP-binding protein n=1 Tax=Parasphaerochaeta coccoides (strain ATCC BAA-1237 / DSM 17374 / SPN1) TaxID=760011 RepID=F4GKD6_PARC1|nr:ABC transporter ATP-binding protein [Parasphaerochaeta coccoides]AEC02332.1 nucleoside ABC transporter ATP-binding protein [Parasphaerochaeta coccoides DSM 17374]
MGYAIEMLDITKTFPGIIANDNITLQVKENEVHALLGENGAGKSTLMSVLFGSYSPDAGTIRLRGDDVKIFSPNVATELGIGMVHQHFKLVHNYTVTENIVLGMEPRSRFGLLDLGSARKRVEQISEQYGLHVDADALVEDITVGQQQRVEILKTLYRNADIIIFDEPTAVLTPQEIDELMDIIRLLKKEGKTIILITHKLKEIKAVADRCTVLRRGKSINTVTVADVSERQLAEMMVGRSVEFSIKKKPLHAGNVVLSIRNLTVKDALDTVKVNDLSIDVHAGEIVGIAGVDGNGQSELMYGLTGLSPIASGQILLDGKDISDMTIRERIERGLGHIPEDRQKHGLVGPFSIGENITLKDYFKGPFSASYGILNHPAMDERGVRLIKEFDIRAGQGTATPAGSLSGGNQQKVIVAREIELSPQVLLVAQPTRGLDVGAIEYIRGRLIAERDKGKAILLISFELDEIMNLCDTIATISKGSIVGIFAQGEVTEHDIGLMMAGTRKNEGGVHTV